MYAQVEKPKESKIKSAANSVGQKKSSGKQSFEFVDNRSRGIMQRKLKAMINRSSDNCTNQTMLNSTGNNEKVKPGDKRRHSSTIPEYKKVCKNVNGFAMQRASLINADHMDGSWEETLSNGKAKKVEAKNLRLKKNKSFPGSGRNSPSADPSSWNWLKSADLTHGKGNPNLVRMHLLNGRLGGPGNDTDNLAPGSGSLNSNHSKHCEDEVMVWMNKGGEVDEYNIEVTYNGSSAYLKTSDGKKAWKDTLSKIEANFKYTDDKDTQHTSTFEAEEDAGLDTKKNWSDH